MNDSTDNSPANDNSLRETTREPSSQHAPELHQTSPPLVSDRVQFSLRDLFKWSTGLCMLFAFLAACGIKDRNHLLGFLAFPVTVFGTILLLELFRKLRRQP